MDIIFEELNLDDNFLYIMSELEEYSNKYNIKVQKGYYKDLRLSTMFESFEFDLYNYKNQIIVQNMIHIPNIFVADKKWHTEFKGGLTKPFTIEDCFKYVNLHSKSKYTNERINIDNDMQEKIGHTKDKKYLKPNSHARRRRVQR